MLAKCVTNGGKSTQHTERNGIQRGIINCIKQIIFVLIIYKPNFNIVIIFRSFVAVFFSYFVLPWKLNKIEFHREIEMHRRNSNCKHNYYWEEAHTRMHSIECTIQVRTWLVRVLTLLWIKPRPCGVLQWNFILMKPNSKKIINKRIIHNICIFVSYCHTSLSYMCAHIVSFFGLFFSYSLDSLGASITYNICKLPGYQILWAVLLYHSNRMRWLLWTGIVFETHSHTHTHSFAF